MVDNKLSDFCTSIGIIEQGKLVISGNLSEIESRINLTRTYRVCSLDSLDAMEGFLKKIGIEEVQKNEDSVQFSCNKTEEEIAALLQDLIRENFRITAFQPVHANLEDLFMKITKGEVA